MTSRRIFSAMLLGAGAAMSCGCVTGVAGAMPAVLESDDAETTTALKAVLAEAMGVARVELGPVDLTASPVVSVLPPKPNPHEGRSTARPTLFDIEIQGGRCVAVRRDTGQAFELNGLQCRALGL